MGLMGIFPPCSGLSRHAPVDSCVWPMESGTIRRCGLTERSGSLLGQALKFLMLKLNPVWKACLPLEVEFSELVLQHYICLPATILPTEMIME